MAFVMNFPEIKPTVQKRTSKAFMDLAILRALTKQAMTGYGINGFFNEKLGITASPSMIYASLSGLERKGWIRCVNNRSGRTYCLTDQGKEMVNLLPSISEEIQRFTRLLLG